MRIRFVSISRTVLCTCLLFLLQFSHASAAGPVLEEISLPATGRQETILNIPHFGRYAMLSQSEQGTALSFINKMSGPSPVSGKPGIEDGRIDAFLDTGNYKIVTYADEHGSGKVDLKVMPFTEKNGDLTPELIDHKLVSAQLADFQQRSYWINISSRQTVLLEAAGRSLGDLRLWRDGNWLLDTRPSSQIIEPETGKPLTVHRISADLNRGLYLLVAYGGESLPWAETSNDQPFNLRMGIPKVAGAGIDYKTTSPFGYDRWLVPASTDYYRLELEKNAPAAISVTGFDDSYAFSRSGRSEQITKESRLPVAEVFTSKGRDSKWEVATITANAGQAYVFQRFSAKKTQVIDERGTYWVSTLHSGYGEDSADATSILTDSTHHRETFVDSRTISLDTSSGWQRRFNILDTLTLYFKVSHQGDYRVEANGIEGEFRFEPFTTDRGTNYKTPKARTLGSNWELDPGFYVLTIIPDRDARGVATLSVYANQKKPVNDSPAHIASRYKSIKIKWNQRYTVYLNRQPDVTSGILVRKYPIDLSQSMPLTLNPGEELSLSVSIPRNGELTAITEDGSLAKFTLKESTSSKDLPQKHNGDRYDVQYGVYVVSLKNHSENARNYQLQFTEASQLESVALPAFNQNLVQRPDFPELTLQQPRFFDLGKKQWAAFNVIVSEPGLYQLESTGLLETRGIIRTRVITRLDGQSANGVGRNFLIQQYLREGSYQLALATEGDTKGHLGAQLKRTSLIDGGQITAGKAARYSLPSGEGLLYHFEIKKAGQYQLQSYGINGNFKVRLEDGDGWPLIKPGQKSNLDLNLRAGKYRLVVLPTELPVRVVTLLKREPSPVSREGHGPFMMDLNEERYTHTWLEPDSGQTRQPDSWTFELPAAAEASLTLSEGMAATLTGLNTETKPQQFSHLKPLKQTLAAGRYRIDAYASRKNNRLDYSLDFKLKELLTGQQRRISAPADIDISIGQTSLIEIGSFGRDDVRAQLFDADGRLLARNDDRSNDWNFNIIRTLPAGRYRLQVNPVGKTQAGTTIQLSEPKALAAKPLNLPAEFTVSKPLIHNYTLDLSAQQGVFAVATQSRDSVSLSLEKRNDNGAWQGIANASGSNALLLAAIDNSVGSGKSYRLKVWSSEQRGAKISVSARLLKTPESPETSLSRGLELISETMLSAEVSAARIQLKSPGMFKVSPQTGSTLFWAGEKDEQLQAYDGFISSADNIWLVSPETSQTLQATRVVLEDDTLQFNVGTNTPVWIDTHNNPGGYDLVVAESRIGLPGVSVLAQNKLDARTMGVGLSSSMALVNSVPQAGKSRIKVWDSGSGGTLLPVRLNRYQFNQPARQQLSAGSHDATLPSQAAISFDLQGGLKDVRFNLPQGVAAVLLKKGEVQRSFWSDKKAQNYQLWSDADSLLILNTLSKERVLAILLNPTANVVKLSPETLFKHYFAGSGNFSLSPDLTVPPGSYLHAWGEQTQLLVQTRQGQVFRGKQVPISGDVLVNVSHGVGLVSVWINHNADFTDTISGNNQPLPAQIKLTGRQQTIVFERDKAGFISLQAATPVIARIRRNGLQDQVSVFDSGLKTTLFLPKGKSQLQLESTTEQALASLLNLTEIAQAELNEGLGNPVSLLPGDTRVYRLNISKPQDIGIGVHAAVDVAQLYLFDQHGALLGEGVSQKHKLTRGHYYLMIELPPQAGSSVDIRPAIVGLESRDTGPSKEIMLDYQQYSSPEIL